jgi:hypothetical protein
VFERGWQFGNLYFDAEVTAFAARHRMALMLAQHCRSKERADMDVVPEHGIGRALVTALDQFAKDAFHPELAWSKLFILGFSGAGSLVARMAGTYQSVLSLSLSTHLVSMTLLEWTPSNFRTKPSPFHN